MEYVVALVIVSVALVAFVVGCETGVRYTKQRYRIGPMHDAIARADRERGSIVRDNTLHTSRDALEKFERKMRLGGLVPVGEQAVGTSVQERQAGVVAEQAISDPNDRP